jgi:hypothetical protein
MSAFRPMKIIKGQTLTGVVELDGCQFVDCVFDGCHLIFRGKAVFDFKPFKCVNKVSVEFKDQALLVLNTCKALSMTVPGLRGYVGEFHDDPKQVVKPH